MDSNKVIASDAMIHWELDNPASLDETKAFWKELRHFYRTGEKTETDVRDVQSALFRQFDDIQSDYPYKLDDKKGITIDLSSQTPFLMLDYLLDEHRTAKRGSFKSKLAQLAAGLNTLLPAEDQDRSSAALEATYDFADQLIAFDKLVGMVPHKVRESISEERLDRLRTVLEVINSGLAQFNDKMATVIVERGLEQKIDKKNVLQQVQVIVADEDVFDLSQKLFSDQMIVFTDLIKAYRIASLEVNGEYDPAIHNEYFDHFNWHRLFEDELSLFQPIVVLVNHTYVFKNLASFSQLLSTNKPITFLVLNYELTSVPNPQVSWEDASHQFRQELAILTISHRNVYTLQAGMDDPSFVYQELEGCINSTAPGVCYLSLSATYSDSVTSDVLIAKSASNGRYFPKVSYDPQKGKRWRDKFDLSGNVQSKVDWPMYTINAQTSDETVAIIDVAFTYADYKAIFAVKAQELMLIPSKHYQEYLIPLADYLQLNEEQLYGKIPYILLIDDQNRLYRAAVPNVWVVSCQERLDYWQFLQEVGGNSADVAHEDNNGRVEETEQLRKEITESLKDEHQHTINRIQKEAVGKAAEQLISVLLADENIQLETIIQPGEDKESVSDYTIDAKEKETDALKSAPQEQLVSNSETAWVESDDCTSCNECTDKYPNLFKYNKEGQAYIEDASKGTFEELVQAAEKCPAACIHPGKPLNETESNLEKLIKRAQKYN